MEAFRVSFRVSFRFVSLEHLTLTFSYAPTAPSPSVCVTPIKNEICVIRHDTRFDVDALALGFDIEGLKSRAYPIID